MMTEKILRKVKVANSRNDNSLGSSRKNSENDDELNGGTLGLKKSVSINETGDTFLRIN